MSPVFIPQQRRTPVSKKPGDSEDTTIRKFTQHNQEKLKQRINETLFENQWESIQNKTFCVPEMDVENLRRDKRTEDSGSIFPSSEQNEFVTEHRGAFLRPQTVSFVERSSYNASRSKGQPFETDETLMENTWRSATRGDYMPAVAVASDIQKHHAISCYAGHSPICEETAEYVRRLHSERMDRLNISWD